MPSASAPGAGQHRHRLSVDVELGLLAVVGGGQVGEAPGGRGRRRQAHLGPVLQPQQEQQPVALDAQAVLRRGVALGSSRWVPFQEAALAQRVTEIPSRGAMVSWCEILDERSAGGREAQDPPAPAHHLPVGGEDVDGAPVVLHGRAVEHDVAGPLVELQCPASPRARLGGGGGVSGGQIDRRRRGIGLGGVGRAGVRVHGRTAVRPPPVPGAPGTPADPGSMRTRSRPNRLDRRCRRPRRSRRRRCRLRRTAGSPLPPPPPSGGSISTALGARLAEPLGAHVAHRVMSETTQPEALPR